jgi:hypothetical protein
MRADSTSVERALESGDYDEAQRLMTLRLARAFDATSSARDLKALSRELRLSMADMQQQERDNADTPLAQILSMARGQ